MIDRSNDDNDKLNPLHTMAYASIIQSLKRYNQGISTKR